jgi:hypothetical protein
LLGISYALRRSLLAPFGPYQFYNGPGEDFRLLHTISNTHDILLIGTIGYYVRGWKIPNFKPQNTTVIPAALKPSQIHDRYPVPFDIKLHFPERFRSLSNGLQEALIQTSTIPCVDPIFFSKRFQVSLTTSSCVV